MSGYGVFAGVYDLLTENIPYDEIAEYYHGKILRFRTGEGNFLLDAGCGTGKLTARMAALGYDVIGADASPDMLCIAQSKPHEGVSYICQSMTELELYGQADVIISTLDSVNHLESKEQIGEFFRRAALNLRCGGLLLFDVNTIYKHREILSDNIFIYDVEGVYCVWQNSFSESDNGVDIELDIFSEREDGAYERDFESFREIALSAEEISDMLKSSGFEVVDISEYLTGNTPAETSEKLMFTARKRQDFSDN